MLPCKIITGVTDLFKGFNISIIPLFLGSPIGSAGKSQYLRPNVASVCTVFDVNVETNWSFTYDVPSNL